MGAESPDPPHLLNETRERLLHRRDTFLQPLIFRNPQASDFHSDIPSTSLFHICLQRELHSLWLQPRRALIRLHTVARCHECRIRAPKPTCLCTVRHKQKGKGTARMHSRSHAHEVNLGLLKGLRNRLDRRSVDHPKQPLPLASLAPLSRSLRTMYSHIPPGAQPHCAPTLKYPLALFIQLHIVTRLCLGPSLPYRLPAHDVLRQDWSRFSSTLLPKHPNTTPTHLPLNRARSCTRSHKQGFGSTRKHHQRTRSIPTGCHRTRCPAPRRAPPTSEARVPSGPYFSPSSVRLAPAPPASPAPRRFPEAEGMQSAACC